MPSKFSIVSISSEVEPFSKSGGLAIVAHSLPHALSQMGHQVIAVAPYYREFLSGTSLYLEPVYEGIPIMIGDEEVAKVNYWRSQLEDDIPIYLVDCERYFGRMKALYGSIHENSRFYLFDLAVIELLMRLNFAPHILHCHDWHTGLIPYLLWKEPRYKEFFKESSTVFTIHNLSYQLGHNWWDIPSDKKDDGEQRLPPFHSEEMEFMNFAKRGILFANAITTVSEQYAVELLGKEAGQELHRILKNREDRFYGIINGIDYEEYNPKTDPGLALNYDVHSIERRLECREALQKFFHLPLNNKLPIIVMTSRIVEQKGMDLVIKLLEVLMRIEIQMIVMGDEGDKHYMKVLRKIGKKYPKKFVLQVPFLHDRETSLYAGADMTLLPSRFEPCGINQLISLRYGCVPIVHKIGGLSDTVTNYSVRRSKGTGFVFKTYDWYDLHAAVIRAIETYQREEEWRSLIHRGMAQSFSWKIPAKKYVSVFRKAMELQKSWVSE
jgi:starch synthase